MTGLLVISPHLDDAVISCGRVIAGESTVSTLTVFAGGRSSWDDVRDWDRKCGFRPGTDVMAARRAEDRRATALLGATPYWLDELDEEYRTSPLDSAQLRAVVEQALAARQPSVVLAPIGLRHADHVALADVCREIWSTQSGQTRWLWYADKPYADVLLGALDARLNELAKTYGRPIDATLPSGSRWRKFRAIRAYRSQYRALGPGTLRRTARASEQFFAFSPPPSVPPVPASQ